MHCDFATHLRGKHDKWEVLKVLLLFLPDTSSTSRIQNKDYNGVSAYIEFTVSAVYYNFYSEAFLCSCIYTWCLPLPRGFSVLSINLCKHRSIHAFCNEFEAISSYLEWMLTGVYKMYANIYTTFNSWPKLTLRVLVTCNNCIKYKMLWEVLSKQLQLYPF